MSHMRDLADTFKALSDETRVKMIALLLDNEELCVCDFVGALGLTQSKASRHLRYLFNAGLVEDRRDGLWIHYRLSSHLTPTQEVIVEALATALEADMKHELEQRLTSWMGEKDSAGCAG